MESLKPVVVCIDGGVRLLPDDQRLIEQVALVRRYGGNPSQVEVVERVADADALVLDWAPLIAPSVLDAARELKLICVAGTGYDGRVNLEACRQRGITVCNAPDFASNDVAEAALGLMIVAAHRLVEADRSVRSGKWDPSRFKGTTLSGKTLGVIGVGRIGSRVAQKAEALGMTVLTARSTTPRNQFESLLMASDVLSLHVQLTPMTQGLLGWEEFDLMKQGVIVINTSRGKALKMEALLSNLSNGKVSAAALDVYSEEPLPMNHALLRHPNVIATPHIASHTVEAERRLSETIRENIVNFLNGYPVNVIA